MLVKITAALLGFESKLLPGLRIWLDDPESKVMYFAFHMNINSPLNGVDFGDYNYVVDEADSNR